MPQHQAMADNSGTDTPKEWPEQNQWGVAVTPIHEPQRHRTTSMPLEAIAAARPVQHIVQVVQDWALPMETNDHSHQIPAHHIQQGIPAPWGWQQPRSMTPQTMPPNAPPTWVHNTAGQFGWPSVSPERPWQPQTQLVQVAPLVAWDNSTGWPAAIATAHVSEHQLATWNGPLRHAASLEPWPPHAQESRDGCPPTSDGPTLQRAAWEVAD